MVRTLVVFLALGLIYLVVNRGAFFGYTWETYNSPDGRFSVELPGKPVFEEQHAQRSDGTMLTYHHVKAKPAARSMFAVAYYERSTTLDPDTIIENVRKNTAARLQAMIIAEKPLTINGLVAREIQFQTPKNVVLTERVIVEADRYYTLMVSTERDPSSEAQNMQRFFDSFKLTHS